MKSKKATGFVWEHVVVALLSISLLAFGFYLYFPLGSAAGQLTAQIDTLSDIACRSSGQLKEEGSFRDDDRDKLPDLSCDNCVPGDNGKDADADGVPDACDVDKNDPNVGFCKGEDGKDCSKSKCCDLKKGEDTMCGAGGKGIIKNIGSEKRPIYQCNLS